MLFTAFNLKSSHFVFHDVTEALQAYTSIYMPKERREIDTQLRIPKTHFRK